MFKTDKSTLSACLLRLSKDVAMVRCIVRSIRRLYPLGTQKIAMGDSSDIEILIGPTYSFAANTCISSAVPKPKCQTPVHGSSPLEARASSLTPCRCLSFRHGQSIKSYRSMSSTSHLSYKPSGQTPH